MRRSLLIGLIAATTALISCGQPASNLSASAEQNAATAAAVAQSRVDSGARSNGLWGVAEGEDEASHRGLDFIAFNRSGRTITGLSIRPVEGPLVAGAPETPWSGNILAQRELPDAQRAAAHYEADIELCSWQVRATFADRQTRDYPAVNLCETIRVDLR